MQRLIRQSAVLLVIGCMLALVMSFFLSAGTAEADTAPSAEIRLGESLARVGGQQVMLEYPAHRLQGAVWASVRPISEGLGATVTWNEVNREATVTLGSRTLRFRAGSSTASINGSTVNMGAPIRIFNGRMQVPLRILGEGLGYKVQWVSGVNEVLFVPSQVSTVEHDLMVRQHPELGRIVTDSRGMTLYAFTRDSAYQSNCSGTCADNWPPLVVDGAGVAAEDINGELGITVRQDGTRQITLNGMPLYYFARDEQPGDINGQGINDVWYVIGPDGALIRRLPQAPPAPEPAAPEPQPQTLQISIENFNYSPASITIKAGDTVTWTNNDTIPHTVTGDDFDSGVLQPGESFRHTFTTTGTFSYICTLHPTMVGSVTVQQP